MWLILVVDDLKFGNITKFEQKRKKKKNTDFVQSGSFVFQLVVVLGHYML